jgi:hypothetical protein
MVCSLRLFGVLLGNQLGVELVLHPVDLLGGLIDDQVQPNQFLRQEPHRQGTVLGPHVVDRHGPA